MRTALFAVLAAALFNTTAAAQTTEPTTYRVTGTRIAVGQDVRIERDEEVSDAVIVVGGNLIIGVDSEGNPLGIEHDYATLKRRDRDGFQQSLIGIVQTYLGADVCPLVHVLFHDVGHKDVCRVVVEPAPRPVYVLEHGTPHYVLRAGNASRELDVREAMQHIAQRWPSHRGSERMLGALTT